MHRGKSKGLSKLSGESREAQTDLALRADVDRNYISLIELGRNSPSVRLLFKLCDALDVAPSDFMAEVQRRMKTQAGQ